MKTTLDLSIFKFCIVGIIKNLKIDAILREAVGDVLGIFLFWQVSSDLLGVAVFILRSPVSNSTKNITDDW